MSRIRERLLKDLQGQSALPLGLLTLLYFYDQFDTAAFTTLAPEIQQAFGLSDEGFGALIVINGALVLLLAIPVGYLADRVPRKPILVVAGIVAGMFSLLTGLVGSVLLLVLVRFGNGIGLIDGLGTHKSMLTDYYRPDSRAMVFGIHASAIQFGAIIGPVLAGVLGATLGWRAAFILLFVPIIVTTVIAAIRLHEPVRGISDDPDAAEEAALEPVGFREGVRTLWAVKTLKRQFMAFMFFGAGFLPLGALLPLYLDRVYSIGPAQRGLIGAGAGVATLIGLLWGAKSTAKWTSRSAGEPLRRASVALATVGLGIVAMAASPSLAGSLVGLVVAHLAIGVFTAPFTTVQATVSPARVRTLSFSFGALFLVAGAIGLFYALGLGSVSDVHGIRWGIAILAPYWVVGAAILATSAKFAAHDGEAAVRSLQAVVDLREQRRHADARSMLLCSGVDVAYDSVQVLFGVDLDVTEGEIVALLGTNGAGKSTLLRAISGLVNPIGGAIFFDGRDVTHADPQRAVELGIIQMPGGRSVFPTLTVRECLRLAGWMYKRRDPEHVREATETVLEYFPVLRDRSDQLAGDLSGGEQQMLGLAMAFIAKPRLLMIDELSLGLAPAIVGRLTEIVRAIHERGTTIILVEQSVNVALTLAHRAVFMEKGEVRFSGPTAELLGRDDILRSVFLQGAVAHPEATTVNGASESARPEDAGSVAAPSPVPVDAPVQLEVVGVTKHFGGIRAVNDVTFQLHEGEILGVIGPNGAGKTSVFDLISGFLVPDAGRVMLAEHDITRWSPHRRSMTGLGRSFQDARLFPSLTVAENIATSLERHLAVRDPVAAALGLPVVAEAELEIAWTVYELVELFGLGAFRNKFVSELSTGSRRIVDLAMAIAHEPSVLILDEPSSGIAQRETEALGPLLLRIQREVGCSLLIIEHDMPLVTSIAHTMVALELGSVVAVGTPDEVINHPEVVASYLGTDDRVVQRSGNFTPVHDLLPEANGHGHGKPATTAARSSAARRR